MPYHTCAYQFTPLIASILAVTRCSWLTVMPTVLIASQSAQTLTCSCTAYSATSRAYGTSAAWRVRACAVVTRLITGMEITRGAKAQRSALIDS